MFDLFKLGGDLAELNRLRKQYPDEYRYYSMLLQACAKHNLANPGGDAQIPSQLALHYTRRMKGLRGEDLDVMARVDREQQFIEVSCFFGSDRIDENEWAFAEITSEINARLIGARVVPKVIEIKRIHRTYNTVVLGIGTRLVYAGHGGDLRQELFDALVGTVVESGLQLKPVLAQPFVDTPPSSWLKKIGLEDAASRPTATGVSPDALRLVDQALQMLNMAHERQDDRTIRFADGVAWFGRGGSLIIEAQSGLGVPADQRLNLARFMDYANSRVTMAGVIVMEPEAGDLRYRTSIDGRMVPYLSPGLIGQLVLETCRAAPVAFSAAREVLSGAYFGDALHSVARRIREQSENAVLQASEIQAEAEAERNIGTPSLVRRMPNWDYLRWCKLALFTVLANEVLTKRRQIEKVYPDAHVCALWGEVWLRPHWRLNLLRRPGFLATDVDVELTPLDEAGRPSGPAFYSGKLSRLVGNASPVLSHLEKLEPEGVLPLMVNYAMEEYEHDLAPLTFDDEEIVEAAAYNDRKLLEQLMHYLRAG